MRDENILGPVIIYLVPIIKFIFSLSNVSQGILIGQPS